MESFSIASTKNKQIGPEQSFCTVPEPHQNERPILPMKDRSRFFGTRCIVLNFGAVEHQVSKFCVGKKSSISKQCTSQTRTNRDKHDASIWTIIHRTKTDLSQTRCICIIEHNYRARCLVDNSVSTAQSTHP